MKYTTHQHGTLTCGEKEAHDELLTAVFVLAESLDKLSKKKILAARSVWTTPKWAEEGTDFRSAYMNHV